HQFTLQQVGMIHRSKYYTDWRQAVAFAFSRIDPILDVEVARNGRPRLVVIVSPRDLPASAQRMWSRIATRGRRLQVAEPHNSTAYLALLLTGAPQGESAPTLPDLHAGSSKPAPYGAWLIEADAALSAMSRHASVARLSYGRLQSYRLRLMNEVQELIE